MRNPERMIGWMVAATALAGCSAKLDETGLSVEHQRSQSLSSGAEDTAEEMPQHCDISDANHEQSSYDTSGDDIPDVRKVFLRVGADDMARLVLVCRETDLNSDGTKDIVRYYNNEGVPLREEADRNFDGQMDEVTFFQEARIIRQEFDTTGDGKVDMKVFFKDGQPLRSERDIAARSTAATWQPDRWEYFEEGRMVRMGTDLDGDGTVDRWDRDETMKAQRGGLRSDEDVVDPDLDAESDDAESDEDDQG